MSAQNVTTDYLAELIYSLDPVLNIPIETAQFQIADGKGGREWNTVFQVLSTQSASENFALPYLPSTLVSLSNIGTGPTGAAAGLFSWITNGLQVINPAIIQKSPTAAAAW